MSNIPYYTKYLQSSHWQKLRKKIYKKKNNQCCVLCASEMKLNLHHAKYKEHGISILYKEKRHHLFVLCENCHKEWHKLNPPLILKQKYISRIRELVETYKLNVLQAIASCKKNKYDDVLVKKELK